MIRGPSAVECGIVEWALGRGRLPLAVAGSDPPGWLDQQADPQLGEAVLARAAAAYQAALGSRLIAGYALGSLAHGGFCPLVSDVDLGLILQDPPRAGDRMTIRKVARSVRAGDRRSTSGSRCSGQHRQCCRASAEAADSLRWTGWTCLITAGC